MENKLKRFLSLVLALVLVGQSLPWSAQAVENTPTVPPYEETEPTESVETEPTSADPGTEGSGQPGRSFRYG